MKHTSPEILRQLVRRFGLLVLLTLLGAIGGAAYGALKTPTYVAQAYVVVTGQAGEGPVAVNFAQAYGRVVGTGPVADKAAATLGSREDLKQVTASTSPDTPVIEITATGTDAKRTAALANAVAQSLVDFGNGRKDQTRVSLSVLAAASVPAAPSSPKPPLELAVGAAAGLLMGGLSVLAGVGRSAAGAGAAGAGAAGAGRAGTSAEITEIHHRIPPPAITARADDGALDYGTRAIAFYTQAPPPQFSPTPPLNDAKIVGRAVVIYRDAR
jgi:capsular polysaccharide biosynthesis protein